MPRWAGVLVMGGVEFLLLLMAIFRMLGIEILLPPEAPDTFIARHHEVYLSLGETQPQREFVWEEHVKRGIIYEISRRVVTDTGNLFPTSEDYSRWLQEHSQEAVELLDQFKKPAP